MAWIVTEIGEKHSTFFSSSERLLAVLFYRRILELLTCSYFTLIHRYNTCFWLHLVLWLVYCFVVAQFVINMNNYQLKLCLIFCKLKSNSDFYQCSLVNSLKVRLYSHLTLLIMQYFRFICYQLYLLRDFPIAIHFAIHPEHQTLKRSLSWSLFKHSMQLI